ncbi:MAG: four helix bundle protein [Acidobacteriota bacterium]|nr:four helix bundle protein [Acidobacteriota bacterium]
MSDEKRIVDAVSKSDLRLRTRSFALRIVRLYTSLPRAAEAQILGKQLLRSGTSVGAHYHEATRARSNAEFISKLEGGLQELEETIYWLNLLIDSAIVKKERLSELCQEADELAAILVASVKTVKKRS